MLSGVRRQPNAVEAPLIAYAIGDRESVSDVEGHLRKRERDSVNGSVSFLRN